MTQIVNCRFQEYSLPEKPKWYDRLLIPVSETLGTSYCRKDKNFTLTLKHPDLFLIPKSKFSVAGSLVQRFASVEFEIVSWTFRFEKDDWSEINLVVREVKLSPFERWFSNLSDGWQYAIAIITLLLPIAIVVSSVYAIVNYPNPLWFWVWFGQHVRGIVGWSLFFLLLIADIWAQVRFRKFAFIRNVLLVLLSFSALLIPLIWSQVSLPPQQLSGKPEEYIQYLDYLRTRLATFILLLAGIIPWLTLFLKWLGLDLLASILGLYAERPKRKTSE